MLDTRGGRGWLVALAIVAMAVGCDEAKTPSGGDTSSSADIAGDTAEMSTVWVDAQAEAGGDGSEEHPFRTLAEGLGADKARVVVAAGDYDLPPSFTVLAALHVAGAGKDATRVVTSTPASWTLSASLTLEQLALEGTLSTSGGELTLRQLRLGGGEDDGVTVQGADRLTVEDTEVEATGGMALESVDNASLARMSFTGGAGVRAEGVATLALNTITVTEPRILGLELVDCGTTGVWVSVSDAKEVETPPGSNNGDAMLINGGTAAFTDGLIDAPADRGMVVDGDAAVTLTGVRFTNGGGRSLLQIQGDGAVVNASGLSFQTGGVAVYLGQGATLELSESSLEGFGNSPILTSGGSDLTVLKCTFHDNWDGHISVLGQQANATIRESTFTQGGQICISAGYTDGTVVIADNVLDGCVAMGIAVSDLTDCVVSGNTVSNVTHDPMFTDVGHGISLMDGVCTISGNTVHDIERMGISLLRAQAEIRDNIIEATGDAGISVVDPGPDRTLVDGNDVKTAKSAGIAILASQADVHNNTVYSTGMDWDVGLGDGIAFAAGDASVVGNRSEANARGGIVFFEGATGVISENELVDNWQWGIVEFCTGGDNSVEIKDDNTFEGNKTGETSLCSGR